jgi:hypothetical protein
MDSTTANVVLFAFHDASRVADVVAAAGQQPGVVSVAVVARSPECEIRIIGRVGDELPEARWLASVLSVLDVLSWPLCVLAASPRDAEALTLPDSDHGFDTFGRLIPRGALVLLLAVCDSAKAAVGSFEREVGAALYQASASGDDWFRSPVGQARW